MLASKPRSLGKSAAEGPNDRLQADLVDFSQNTRGRAETVTRAAAEIILDLVQEDLGNEFRALRRRCPEGRCTGKRTPRTAMQRRSQIGRFKL